MRASPLLFFALAGAVAHAAAPAHPAACRTAALEGELTAGRPYSHGIGNGLQVYFQPIASGWILRVGPVGGVAGEHDYAELATPPYQSITPLSLSTDFAFRAQDAVGWNPRRFRFATSPESFRRLEEAYFTLEHAGATPPPPVQVALSTEIAKAAEASLTLLDARLTPGTADQWSAAATVASHFLTTAHTLVPPPDGKGTPLGRLLWVRFRLQVELPPGFAPDKGMRILPQLCGSR